MAGFSFRVVDSFRYLGLLFDSGGTADTLVEDMVGRARRAFGGLCEFLGTQRWRVPWTRLVLFDIYVRSLMTFGAAVWAPLGMDDTIGSERRYLL